MSEILHIEIAGKRLPVRVDEGSRTDLMDAVRLINEKMAEFEKNYAIKDKSELLAMVTLSLVTVMAKRESEMKNELSVLHQVVEEIQSMLQWHRNEKNNISSDSDQT